MKGYAFWTTLAILFVLFQGIWLWLGFILRGSIANALMWELFLVNIVGGPLCLIGYLVEVRRGVFKEKA